MSDLRARIERQAGTELVAQLFLALDERDWASAREGMMTSLGESTAVELEPA